MRWIILLLVMLGAIGCDKTIHEAKAPVPIAGSA